MEDAKARRGSALAAAAVVGLFLTALTGAAAPPPGVARTTTADANPLLANIHTADPAVHVFGDRLFVYADHDPAGPNDGWISMYDYHAYSTGDLKTWVDHGSVLNCRDVTWNDGPA